MYLDPHPNRILTTHTGSLPRPAELAQAIVDRETGAGAALLDAVLGKMIAHAVVDDAAHQRAVGVDIVSDGEASKIGYSTYVKERLSGFGGAEGALSLADLDDHPAFAERALGALVTRMPSCDGPVAYVGQDLLKNDLDNLTAALDPA